LNYARAPRYGGENMNAIAEPRNAFRNRRGEARVLQ